MIGLDSRVEQQDLDFKDIEDGPEAVERGGRTTITNQVDKGQTEYLRVRCS